MVGDTDLKISCHDSLCNGHGECTRYNTGLVTEFVECICNIHYTGQRCEHQLPLPWETVAVAIVLAVAFLVYLIFCTEINTFVLKKEMKTPTSRTRLVDYMYQKNTTDKRRLRGHYRSKADTLPEEAQAVLQVDVKDDERTIDGMVCPAYQQEQEKLKEEERKKLEEEKKKKKSEKSGKHQKSILGADTTKEMKKLTDKYDKVTTEEGAKDQKLGIPTNKMNHDKVQYSKAEVEKKNKKEDGKLSKEKDDVKLSKEKEEDATADATGDTTTEVIPVDAPDDMRLQEEEKTRKKKEEREAKKEEEKKKKMRKSKNEPKSKPKK